MRPKTLDLCQRYLFTKIPDTVAPQYHHRIRRIRSAYTYWLDFPMTSELDVRKFIEDESSCSKTQAYEDVQILKALLGNVANAGKEWHRYRLIKMVEETYALAKEADDTKGMNASIANYGKFNQLDRPDVDPIPWEQLMPPVWEPTSDPSVLGIKPIPNLRKKISDLKKKYNSEIDAIDIDYVEIREEEDISE